MTYVDTLKSLGVPQARAMIFRAVPGGNPTTVIGSIDLVERNGVVTLTGSINGLPQGPHAIHVHQYGDLGNGCNAAGGHFNPLRAVHGMQLDPPSRRHVGDLGNLMTPAQGPTQVSISDSLMTFVGLRGVIGRALVIHAMIDDLGRGGVPASLTTGNAGGRLACGVIGYIAPSNLQ
ncbi:hypothetical protein KIN20_012668 [Parelaphostrongylus tenuis]|uniref:Superoxide dismutase [Cu-Zn] n=1 Tax=Parelaphostrongylus tenuis TaxID=148309 RepID=A0AAD5MFK0_PARTN|nr:hypothetical protein KIN20_012668 [Parelaphostrongylus tenuis]